MTFSTFSENVFTFRGLSRELPYSGERYHEPHFNGNILTMTVKERIRTQMESFQEWTRRFALLVHSDTGSHAVNPEGACTIVAVIVGMVAVLVEGKVTPGVIQRTVKWLEPFTSRRVEGADLARRYCGNFVIPDSLGLPRDEVEKRNSIEDQLHHYRRYVLPTRWAIDEVSRFPEEERSIRNLRAAFLRNVDQYNLLGSDEESLDLHAEFGFEYA